MTSRSYTPRDKPSPAPALAVIVVVFGAGVFAVSRGAGRDQPLWFIIPFWAAWFSVLVYGAYQAISSPTEIIVHDGDQIEFVSSIGRTKILAQNVESVRAVTGRRSYLLLRHVQGKIRLTAAFDDIHVFLSELKEANPGVDLIGC